MTPAGDQLAGLAPASAGGGVRAPIAVALDAPDTATALAWARAVGPHVAVLKIGMELFYREGPGVVEAVRALPAAAGAGVFLDLKLHDIPTTVAGGVRSVARLAPRYLTVHAAGGSAMLRAAVAAATAAAEASGAPLDIAAVTVLTSLSDGDLSAVGLAGPAREATVRLAELAVEAGARALVCSPREVTFVRNAVGSDVTLITPGIRPFGASADDQERFTTPEQAIFDGADVLVVGRPITAAADPGAVAAALARRLSQPENNV